MMKPRDRIHALDQLAQLYARLGYIEYLDERHGVNRGRMREYNALTFAIEIIEERYPGTGEEARALADNINRHRSRLRGDT